MINISEVHRLNGHSGRVIHYTNHLGDLVHSTRQSPITKLGLVSKTFFTISQMIGFLSNTHTTFLKDQTLNKGQVRIRERPNDGMVVRSRIINFKSIFYALSLSSLIFIKKGKKISNTAFKY